MKIKLEEKTIDEILTSIARSSFEELCKEDLKDIPDFILEATNVYRTKEYIVKQEIKAINDSNLNTYLISKDTYYLRNDYLNDLYEYYFANRKVIDGKRIPVSMYTREYIED